MIIAPRIVAVDDRPEHLHALTTGFDSIGGLCVGIEFITATQRTTPFVTGVRILFMDINLLPGAAANQGARTFAPIASIISKIISRDNGPFALVTWTENTASHDALMTYLGERLAPELQPCAAFCLSKAQYLDDAPALVDRLKTLRDELPGLAMLLDWEIAVTNAADRSVFEIMAMSGKRGTAAGAAVAQIVRAVGTAAAGAAAATAKPFQAFTHGMSPVLTDRLDFSAPDANTEDSWKEALGSNPIANPTDLERAHLNNFFQLASVTGSATSSLGAVYGLSTTEVLPFLSPAFPSGRAAKLSGEFAPIKGGQLQDKASQNRFVKDCEWRFVQLGAACDHVNGKTRVIEGHLGLEVPERQFGSTNLINSGQFRDVPDKKDWLFQSPPFAKKGKRFVLVFNLRYKLSIGMGELETMRQLYRLREGLASEIAIHSANFSTRPGILEFR